MVLLFSKVLFSCILLCSCQPKDKSREPIDTAISAIQPLMKTHELVIKKLESYIESEENKLNILNTYLKRYIEEDNNTNVGYTLNPINAFILIKRTTRDINTLADFTLNTIISVELLQRKQSGLMEVLIHEFVILRVGLYLPEEVDLKGACRGVHRIQQVYNIDTTSLFKGEFRGMKLNSEMTVEDCYTLGSCLYRNGEFRPGIDWFIEAYEGYRREEQKDIFSFTEPDIIARISFGFDTLNNSYKALLWLKKLLEIDYSIEAENEASQKVVHHYEKRKPYAKTKPDGDYELKLVYSEKNQYIAYKKTCNDETKIPEEITKRLKCSYLSDTNPFLKLAPIKREQLYTEPDIFLFYDVINERESNYLKKSVLSGLESSTFQQKGKVLDSIEIRVGRSAWANDDELTERISQRIEDCSGLNMDFSEVLQISNYGVGGYFTPHFDNFNKNYSSFHYDRLSTFLIFMTELTEGATAFPEIGLKVNPVKGAMLYFDNLLPTGKGDPRTLHAGCPVLKGDKWIAVKWIHTPGQELVKKCSSDYKPVHLEIPCESISGYPGIVHVPKKLRRK